MGVGVQETLLSINRFVDALFRCAPSTNALPAIHFSKAADILILAIPHVDIVIENREAHHCAEGSGRCAYVWSIYEAIFLDLCIYANAASFAAYFQVCS